jgi:integrase
MTQAMRTLVKACVIGKKPTQAVFTRKVRGGDAEVAVSDFRRAWEKAVVAAGLGKLVCPKCSAEVRSGKCEKCKTEVLRKDCVFKGLLFHDLRRTAARNLRNRNVAQEVIMQIGGWKTAEVFRRYSIVDQSDIANAMQRLEAGRAPAPAPVEKRGASEARKLYSGRDKLSPEKTAAEQPEAVLPN